ncbi:protein TPX2-like [Pistacia vera]|uniref:protein TPX2-like n=1 Tax=Pistacia vera TaxID=55513 RepID=UPI0012632ECE|nr:protein TPX2-like [Pistacia vera]
MDKCSQNSYLIENLATKRQKLDAGYLCKVSHLKHQALFLHKVPNKAGHLGVSLVHPRSKVTIPREPNLETANRAQRHRSKFNAESAEHAKSNTSAFKARPLNRKIFESPALPLTKKSTLPLTECQEFQLRTSERARQHAHNNVATRCNHNSVSQNETKDSIRPNSVNSLKEEKCEVTQKVKSHPCHKKLSKGELGVLQNIKQETRVPLELDFPEDKTFLNQPPIELFNKLSLASVHTNIKPHSKMPPPSKGSKENTESSFHLEHQMMKAVKKNSPSFGHNQCQCGSESTDRRNTEAGARYNINRNLDIR